MFKHIFTIAVVGVILSCTVYPNRAAYAGEGDAQDLIVLCYHDIPKEVNLDDHGVDQKTFINTIEFFRRHEYTFISLDDLIAARQGIRSLPGKAVMLTFDDGYRSFYDFVYPLLAQYKIPSLLAVVSHWIDGPKPDYVINELMTWKQIREVAGSEYVEVISHSHDLHKGILYNPQGNEAAAAVSRLYTADQQSYEDEAAYRERIMSDLKSSKRILEEKTGRKIRAIAWPYGMYNRLTVDEAGSLGFETSFSLNDERATVHNLDEVPRFLVRKNPTVRGLRKHLKLLPDLPEQKRAVQVDLDWVYDNDPAVTERNLGILLDRIKALAPSVVYLQAFADEDGDGNVSAVYFPNRVLPVKADLFNRVAHQLRTRAYVEVYAWMPVLSVVLPDSQKTDRLRVREKKDGTIQAGSSWYARLSPFSDEAVHVMTQLYEDLSVHAYFDGVIFQDDGYLTDYEDFHPDALNAYTQASGMELSDLDEDSYKKLNSWVKFKTKRLNEVTLALQKAVRQYRPEAKFARTLYAPVLINEASENWFAQNFEDSLAMYDYVVVMAYPRMEKAKNPRVWLTELVRRAQEADPSLRKTVFKIQAYDWETKEWIEDATLESWMRAVVAAGARHVAYYPDDFLKNKPDGKMIHTLMSKEDFPFKRTWR